ncbi:uncharacterized protein LOC128255206 [Drosophila gunungcola]|uniref:RING-type domain-containing protein n=1 Tax=Drosophila gunungcola TaxID=103775 RepID=A0A9Q0BNH5_9MUSC|nr:uncharacterized protein LOC128255206 [Drosophila gunungcola]KAI8038722.1 hypothetical protein M5D96_008630 [Drosophila gunungcola]
MPCENCGVEFTVFRRKRACFDCKRYYCANCIAARRCQRCSVFAQRPLLRTDLLKLKPKDLIFYLQSKHISTEGCLEKEELVGLVLTHVAQVDRSRGSNASSNSPGRGQANPIDSIKQSCQNFFSNLTDNINDSLASFDSKASAKPPENRQPEAPSHIFEQPRVSTREIPTYASAVNGGPQRVHVHQAAPTTTATNGGSQSSSSPSTSTQASTNRDASSCSQAPVAHQQEEREQEEAHSKSDCECSDDEIMATFSERVSLSLRTDTSGRGANAPAEPIAGAGLVADGDGGPEGATAVSPGCSKPGSSSSKADASSQSSFEELGAIGGISDESKATTDTNSSHLDQWQVLEVNRIEAAEETPTTSAAEEILEVTLRSRPAVEGDDGQLGESSQTLNIEQRPANPSPAFQPAVPQRTKKVTRRRSDGYLNRRYHSSDDESPVAPGGPGLSLGLSTLSEQPETGLHAHSHRQSCQRCGKNKTNIRRHVEKMRRHLENSQMSEEDIKRELQEFLTYLEQRTKSVDVSDADSHAVSPLSVDAISVAAGGRSPDMPITPTIEFSPTQDDDIRWDDDEGIHVYAAPLDFEPAAGLDSRFVNLEDIEDLKELEGLTVKQLKEVLMLHRVDYKGCCEKQELLDRVSRLWKTMRESPAVEKLPTDELCKICMDAPIECVFLECGHMATCTSCGKVLNECPICRQYIVRVVRFFRA